MTNSQEKLSTFYTLKLAIRKATFARIDANPDAMLMARNCRRIQLTSNKLPKDAHRFDARLGFVASHEGMKLVLN